jgi:hypothetical protein
MCHEYVCVCIQNWLNYTFFTKWHIMPNIQNGKSSQTWKNGIWFPRYKMALIGHSLTTTTLTTIMCILEVDISPLT